MHQKSKQVFGTDGPTLQDVREVSIPGGGGGPIPARFYRDSANRTPLVIYYHGGGWVVGDLDSHDGLCRLIAKESGFGV
ncbi:MAG: alpha/beta hydrolase, partial [Gammaproteobacteria bacterium]|nr:alpha/beta hydrolase [Gammaproteobacteria bacterium]